MKYDIIKRKETTEKMKRD